MDSKMTNNLLETLLNYYIENDDVISTTTFKEVVDTKYTELFIKFNKKYLEDTLLKNIVNYLSTQPVINYDKNPYKVRDIATGQTHYITINRNDRYLLYDKSYIDYDIVNCHPVIIFNLLRAFELVDKYPFFTNYINNRSSVIDQLYNDVKPYLIDVKMETVKISLKKFMNILLNGGSDKTIFKDENLLNKYLKDSIKEDSKIKWSKDINELIKEVNLIKKFLIDSKELKQFRKKFDGIKDSKGSTYPNKSSIIYFMCCYIERIIINECYLFIRDIKNNNVENICYSYDGFNILKSDINFTIEDLENHIYNKLNINVNFSIKTPDVFKIKNKFISEYCILNLDYRYKDLDIIDYILTYELEYKKNIKYLKFESQFYFFNVKTNEIIDIFKDQQNVTNEYFSFENIQYYIENIDKKITNEMIKVSKGEDKDKNEAINKKYDSLIKRIDNLISTSHVKKFIEIIINYKTVKGTDRCTNMNELYFYNGILDVVNGTFEKYDLDNLKLSSIVIKYNFDYNRFNDDNAMDQDMKILYDNYFYKFEKDFNKLKFLFQYISTSLLASNKIKKILIFKGHGNNGKSFIFSIFKHLLNSYSSIMNNEFLQGSYKTTGGADNYLYSLNNKRLVLVNELDDKLDINTKVVKVITGEESSETRKYHTQIFTNINICLTPIVSVNKNINLDIKNISESERTRYNLFLCHSKFTEDDNIVDNVNIYKVDRSINPEHLVARYNAALFKLLIINLKTIYNNGNINMDIPEIIKHDTEEHIFNKNDDVLIYLHNNYSIIDFNEYINNKYINIICDEYDNYYKCLYSLKELKDAYIEDNKASRKDIKAYNRNEEEFMASVLKFTTNNLLFSRDKILMLKNINKLDNVNYDQYLTKQKYYYIFNKKTNQEYKAKGVYNFVFIIKNKDLEKARSSYENSINKTKNPLDM